MKYLILIALLSLSFEVVAGNFMALSKDNSGNYRSLNDCVKAEGENQGCEDITGKNLEYWELKEFETEDDKQPVLREKYNMTSCSDFIDCGNKIQALNLPKLNAGTPQEKTDYSGHCDQNAGDYIFSSENKLMPGWSFYCTGVISYKKVTVKRLVENQTLKGAFIAKQNEEKIKADKLESVSKHMAFGVTIKQEMFLLNAAKNLSSQQIQDFVDEFASIGRLLDVGAISAAKDRIANITPGTSVSEEEKQYILNKMATFLSAN